MSVIFIWETLIEMHLDRCNALAKKLGTGREVIAIGIVGNGEIESSTTRPFVKQIILFRGNAVEAIPISRQIWRMFWTCLSVRQAEVFLCHYERPGIFLVACLLRLCGRAVYTMNNSKFDDKERYSWREFAKSFFLLPYLGALASGRRSRDYLAFLGMRSSVIYGGYNTLSSQRIRAYANLTEQFDGVAYADRYFAIVARLVTKKNISMALNAYQIYRGVAVNPRELRIVGSGPLENDLRSEVRDKKIEGVIFEGAKPNDEVARLLIKALVLILPSTEEQFGNVVIEAQALNLPVILSDNCGACDELVRTGVNGFVVEPHNAEGLAYFMSLLAEDEGLWSNMKAAIAEFSYRGEPDLFAKEALALLANRG